jgi:hypothetical protein
MLSFEVINDCSETLCYESFQYVTIRNQAGGIAVMI